MQFFSLIPAVFAKELPTFEDTGVASIASLETLFSNIVRIVMSLGAVALFLMFVVGGFSFLFSGGDQKKLEQARGTLSNAIIGLVIIVTAYLLIKFIGVFTGTNITTFTIPPPTN